MCPNLPDVRIYPTLPYEVRSFNCGTGVQQGALLNISIFHSFQTVDVFHHDINSASSLKVQALNADK